MIIRHYLVSGKVQGVGYRQFALKQALAIGLQGCVRNLSDRRVEIIVAGTDTQIRPFEAMLAKGPKGSLIEGIERAELDSENLNSFLKNAIEHDFEVVADGSENWNF